MNSLNKKILLIAILIGLFTSSAVTAASGKPVIGIGEITSTVGGNPVSFQTMLETAISQTNNFNLVVLSLSVQNSWSLFSMLIQAEILLFGSWVVFADLLIAAPKYLTSVFFSNLIPFLNSTTPGAEMGKYSHLSSFNLNQYLSPSSCVAAINLGTELN